MTTPEGGAADNSDSPEQVAERLGEIDDELRRRAREGLLLQHPTVDALNTLGTLELEDEARRLRGLNSPDAADSRARASKPGWRFQLLIAASLLVVVLGLVRMIWAIALGQEVWSGLIGGVGGGVVLFVIFFSLHRRQTRDEPPAGG
ncbi:hypothetical protein C3481_13160 [Microbacterium sp. Ru50]|uniref:hypothetical protein n=1 Tax=Microbacterium sp. Ru50 TaxID=2080744 RepID=UPI000CDE4F34|nr:hypothetical protein [Microbacterium sp. Ru50]POX66238.1 hypothetical protein C3481_13160 [Microbacterium sp. Ru50]